MNLSKCNVCKSSNIHLWGKGPEFEPCPYYIKCEDCGACSPMRYGQDAAYEAADQYGLEKKILLV